MYVIILEMKRLLFLLLIATTFAFATNGTEDVFPKATNFVLRGVTGNRLNLNEDLANRPVVIIFWATWCEPCVQLMEDLAKIKWKLPKDTAVITIALGDTWKTLRSYKKTAPFEIYYGGKWLANRYKVWGMPTIYILDRQHRIREKFSGYINIKRIPAAVKKIL